MPAIDPNFNPWAVVRSNDGNVTEPPPAAPLPAVVPVEGPDIRGWFEGHGLSHAAELAIEVLAGFISLALLIMACFRLCRRHRQDDAPEQRAIGQLFELVRLLLRFRRGA